MPPKPGLGVRLITSFLATTGLAIAAVAWSESTFYGRWRPDDSLLNLVWTVVGYGLVVQIVRFVASRWQVVASGRGAWRRVFLAGALYGWLVEGVLVTTVVDDLPLTIPNTGLSWHALFTVLLGWYWIPRWLEGPLARSVLPLVIVGACVGAWASFWKFEEGALQSVPEYALFVGAVTAGYAAGLALWWGMRVRSCPGIPGTVVASALLLALAVGHALERPITLLGPALVALALVALLTTRPRVPDAALLHSALLPTGGPAPFAALWRLAIIPAVAVPVFAVITAAPEAIPSGWPFFLISVPLGAALFVIAWWRSVADRRVRQA